MSETKTLKKLLDWNPSFTDEGVIDTANHYLSLRDQAAAELEALEASEHNAAMTMMQNQAEIAQLRADLDEAVRVLHPFGVAEWNQYIVQKDLDAASTFLARMKEKK